MQSSNISHASSADRRITWRNRLKCIIEVYFEQRKNETYSRTPPRVDAFRRPLANIFFLGDAMIFAGKITVPTSKSKLEESCFKISVKYRSPLVYTVAEQKWINIFLFNKMYMKIVEENIYLSFTYAKRKISWGLIRKIENAFISFFSPSPSNYAIFLFQQSESE